MKVYNIAIIGVGNFGSRHLQALKKLQINVNIEVVGKSAQSIKSAQVRYDELPNNHCINQIKYHNKIESLSNNLDIVIVSTNSDVRKNIVKQLVYTKKIRYFILEKVAFTSNNDFKEILKLLKTNQIKAWVNCPHRTLEHHKHIKSLLKKESNIVFTFEGNSWGLACNSIHYLDLISFLTDDEINSLDNKLLDDTIHKSKRKGFIEFTGTLLGYTKKGHRFKLTSHLNNTMTNNILTIDTSTKIYTIDESQNRINIYSKTDNSNTKLSCVAAHQSDLSHHFIHDIIESGCCSLSSLEESYSFHKPMLETFHDHLNKTTGINHSSCPIT